MITRLEVDGFKSLRDFAIDLEPFTVLIGPNSAGKSNVLDALALLSRLASQPIVEAFKGGRGQMIDQFSRHRGQSAERIRFAVELLEYGSHQRSPEGDEPTFQSRFRYELTIQRSRMGSGVERPVARAERLVAMRREDDAWIAAHPELASVAGYAHAGEETFHTIEDDDGSTEQQIIGVPAVQGPPHEMTIPARYTALAKFDLADKLVRENLELCRVLNLGAGNIGHPSQPMNSAGLAADASNLPTVLANLPPRLLGEIRADLASLISGVASFDVLADGDRIRLDFELTGGERIPGWLVSAGTLRTLALLTSLRTEDRPHMLCIEEPENGIYPGRLRALLALLRGETERDHGADAEGERRNGSAAHRGRSVGAADRVRNRSAQMNLLPTQIIIMTHSPVALASLRAHPRHLRFIDMIRRNGERITRARKVGELPEGDHGRSTIPPREIDTLLQAAQSEDPA